VNTRIDSCRINGGLVMTYWWLVMSRWISDELMISDEIVTN